MALLKQTVLCFVWDRAQDRLLMIHKKRGQGVGKWNVPGGKVQEGETHSEAAARECCEETGILPAELQEVGKLEFYFPENENWDNACAVFSSERYSGALVEDTEECSAEWVKTSAIPYGAMWEADRAWVPLLLAGKPFHRSYVFDRLDHVKEEKDLLEPVRKNSV